MVLLGIGWILWKRPFSKFNVSIIATIDKSIDSFAQ
jgi:hypothetical protein